MAVRLEKAIGRDNIISTVAMHILSKASRESHKETFAAASVDVPNGKAIRPQAAHRGKQSSPERTPETLPINLLVREQSHPRGGY